MSSSAPPDAVTITGTKGTNPGRSLTSQHAHAPGALIATFTNPTLALPAGPSAKHVCAHCLSHTLPTKACTGCKCVVYCSTTCQKANWTAIHKLECKVFKRVTKTVGKDWLPTPVRALVQVLLRWDGDEEVRAVFGRLEGNVDRWMKREEAWKDVGLQAYGAMAYAGRRENDDELHMARDILCKIQTNSFDRTDADAGQAGIFLHPTLAMINHSCVPNAAVSFTGRQASLRAEVPIKAGDEITISYIDYVKPKLFRSLGLALYHFDCVCPRCKDDLSVYDVCRISPVVPLNSLSLVPNLKKLRQPPIDPPTSPSELRKFRSSIDEIYVACQSTDPSQTSTTTETRLAHLRHQWEQCQPLIQASMWAQEPLGLTIEHAVMYYTQIGSFAHALSVACFAALNCASFQYPAPFKDRRLKGLMVIAKILTNTASPSAMDQLETRTDPRVMKCLRQADQVAICEALALMVEKLSPMAHSKDWDIRGLAKNMLQEIASLEGRDKEAGLLSEWAKSQDKSGMKYFQDQVLAPIEDLAGLAVDVMKADFDA